MGNGHTHRGGRRFNPKRGHPSSNGASNGPRAASTPENAGSETASPKAPRPSTPALGPRPPRAAAQTPPPANRPGERTAAQQRAIDRQRQAAPGEVGPQQRPFVQTARPRRDLGQPPRHQIAPQVGTQNGLPHTSGAHPRPIGGSDHMAARRAASSERSESPAQAYTYVRPPASLARQGDDGTPPDETELPTGASAEGTATASDDEATAQHDATDADPGTYRHTQHEPVRPEVRGDVGPLIEALHELFERDRGTASQGASARCGICYLHFPLADLTYREDEGFYVCPNCATSLGHAQVFMVRRQQK